MDLITVTRWTQATAVPAEPTEENTEEPEVTYQIREYFTLRADAPLTSPVVNISWESEDGTHSLRLMGTEVQGNTVTGYIDAEVEGLFVVAGTIPSITITDGDDSAIITGVEKPVPTEVELDELLQFSYPDPLTVVHQYTDFKMVSIVNRIADGAGSGISLRKEVVAGWSLPGVLTPEVITEERIAELLGQEYDLESAAANRVYLLGEELVFFRSNPSGNQTLRIPIAEAYSIRTTSMGSGDPGPLDQITEGVLSVRVDPTGISHYSPPPSIPHFQADIDAIFSSELRISVPRYYRDGPFPVPAGQDRSLDHHYSTPRTLNWIPEEQA